MLPPVSPDGLAANTLWNAVASIATGFTGIACNIIVARMLGPAGTGQVALATWLAMTIGQLAGLGIPQATLRYLAAGTQERAPGLTRWLGKGTFILAIVPAVVLALAHAVMAGTSPALLAGTAILASAQMLASYAQSVFAGHQGFRMLARMNVLAATAQVVVVAAGALLAGSVGAVLGYAAGSAIGSIMAVRFVHAAPSGEVPPDIRWRVRRYALHSWTAVAVSLVAWSRLEFAFLEASGDRHGIAMFSVALTLSQLATQVPLLLGGALLAHFSALAGTGDLDAGRRMYARATQTIAFVAFPMCFGTAALAPTLVPLLFGRAFSDAVPAASVLVVFGAIGAIATVGSSFVYATERSRFIALSGAASAAVAIVAFAYCIPRWGATGAAWARSIVQCLSVAVGIAYIKASLGSSFPLQQVAKVAAGAALSAGSSALAIRVPTQAWLATAAGLLVYIATYLLATRYLRLLGSEEVEGLDALASRMHPSVAPLARRLVAALR
jgi:O-antigen/teichoic acid export membrane protein